MTELVDFAAAVQKDASAVFELCSQDPARPIPSCPEWTAAELAEHLVEIFTGTLDGFGEASGLAAADALERALGLMGSAKPEAARAVAQECAVHCWDASMAFGLEYAVDPELAVDGIPDFFEAAWPMLLDYLKRPAGQGETLHLHRTDGEGEWLVTLADRPVVTLECRKADVAVRGTASDLFLWLWGRMDPPEVHGDRTVLEGIRNPNGRFLSPGF